MRPALGLGLLLAAAAPAAADEAVIAVGKPFPVLHLPVAGHEEDRQSIELYRGRKVMLHLFASW